MHVSIKITFESMRIYFEDKVKRLKTHFNILNTIRLQSGSSVSSSVVWLVRGSRSEVTNQEAGVRTADVPLLWPDANQKRIQVFNIILFRCTLVVAQVLPAVVQRDFPPTNASSREHRHLKLPHWETRRVKKRPLRRTRVLIPIWQSLLAPL